MLTFDSCIMNVNVNSTTRTELQPNFLSISFGPLPNKRYLAKKLTFRKLWFMIHRNFDSPKISMHRKFWYTENFDIATFRTHGSYWEIIDFFGVRRNVFFSDIGYSKQKHPLFSKVESYTVILDQERLILVNRIQLDSKIWALLYANRSTTDDFQSRDPMKLFMVNLFLNSFLSPVL